MMVVIVVSRRDGQVTLAVSLRTSCRNLNGLKAIVWVASVVTRFFWNPNSPIAPNPHLEGEPQGGLDCPGMKKAAPEIRNGPAAGAAMYCAGSARSRRFACGKIGARALGSDENRFRLKRLTGVAG